MDKRERPELNGLLIQTPMAPFLDTMLQLKDELDGKDMQTIRIRFMQAYEELLRLMELMTFQATGQKRHWPSQKTET